MYVFKDGSAQRCALLVAASPVFKAVADFLAASAVWDGAYEMFRSDLTTLTASAKRSGVAIGYEHAYPPKNDADRNARAIYEVLHNHYLAPAMERLRRTRTALLAVAGNDGQAFDFDLAERHIVSAVMPEKDDLVAVTPIRVE